MRSCAGRHAWSRACQCSPSLPLFSRPCHKHRDGHDLAAHAPIRLGDTPQADHPPGRSPRPFLLRQFARRDDLISFSLADGLSPAIQIQIQIQIQIHILHFSSFIFHLSSFIFHLSSFILHPKTPALSLNEAAYDSPGQREARPSPWVSGREPPGASQTGRFTIDSPDARSPGSATDRRLTPDA